VIAHTLIGALTGFDYLLLSYVAGLMVVSLALLVAAATGLARDVRRAAVKGHDDIFANPLTPGVTLVVPVCDTSLTLVASVHSMLAVRYPSFEVVVVDDGSADATFARLDEAYDLVLAERAIPADVATPGVVTSVHRSRTDDALIVVTTTGGNHRSDSTNVGINVARMPLVCILESGSLLEPDSLLTTVKPFMDDPARVVACGGVVRAVNGSRVERGSITECRMPTSWLARVQVVEQLRSFLLRTGWSRLGGLLEIPAAFGVFRRDVIVEVGGLHSDSASEDSELVARICHRLRDLGRDHRVVFVPEPVCWSVLPDALAPLAERRRRQSRGLAELLWIHRGMMLNRRYGVLGLITLPYLLLVDLLGPLVELLGLAAVLASWRLGLLGSSSVLLIACAAITYALVRSLVTLLAEELSYRRYRRWRDLAALLGGVFAEHLGIRQLEIVWRLQGLLQAIRARPARARPAVRSGVETPPRLTPSA
jgi:cellulose synthase/poly-beta-1,6-N-acetylglucosamine synthase-like glycosyltransferase